MNITIRHSVTRTTSPMAVAFLIPLMGVVSLGPIASVRLGVPALLEHVRRAARPDGGRRACSISSGSWRFIHGLQRTTVVHANVVSASQVAMAAVAGMALFREPPNPWLVLGVGLTIVGICAVRSPCRRWGCCSAAFGVRPLQPAAVCVEMSGLRLAADIRFEGIRDHQNFPTVRRTGQKGRRNAPAAGGRRADPHPGRLGHLRTRRRQRSGARRVPQAHRRLRPQRHRPAPDRLHRPLQPRADRRRDGARPDAGQVRAGRSAAGPRDLHAARPAGPAGAGARARRPDREARPARNPDLRQRPLRMERAAAVRRGAGREAPRRRACRPSRSA